MVSLILAALTAVPGSPSALQYYSQALATMQRLAQPAHVSFETNVTAHGMGIADPCDHGKIRWSLGWGRGMHNQLAWHAQYDSAGDSETIRTAEGETCRGPAETFDRPTWRDVYAWVRYGIFSQGPNDAAQAASARTAHTTPAALKTIADVSVISPGAYWVSDGGAQRCPSGSPGHELHFAARLDRIKHPLRDAVVETQSMRICMIRFDLGSYQAIGTGFRGDMQLDFGVAGGSWLVTRGHAALAMRMAGLSLKSAVFDFWYTDVNTSSTVP